MKSDTPETDAHELDMSPLGFTTKFVISSFAKRLERERDHLRKMVEMFRDASESDSLRNMVFSWEKKDQ
jgi:hypothetical protein